MVVLASLSVAWVLPSAAAASAPSASVSRGACLLTVPPGATVRLPTAVVSNVRVRAVNVSVKVAVAVLVVTGEVVEVEVVVVVVEVVVVVVVGVTVVEVNVEIAVVVVVVAVFVVDCDWVGFTVVVITSSKS